MKHPPLNIFLLSLLIFPLCAAAGEDGLSGYYTEEEVRTFPTTSGEDKVLIRKSWYADDRMIKDESWMGKTIARFDLGKMYILDATTETCIEVDDDFMKNNTQNILNAFAVPDESSGELHFPEDLFVRTETTKQIGRWNCYQVITNPQYRKPESPYTVLWYSQEVDFDVELYGIQLKQLFGDSPEIERLFSRITQFKGYPVRTEFHAELVTTITTLTKIERKTDIDPILFEVPEGYKKISLRELDRQNN